MNVNPNRQNYAMDSNEYAQLQKLGILCSFCFIGENYTWKKCEPSPIRHIQGTCASSGSFHQSAAHVFCKHSGKPGTCACRGSFHQSAVQGMIFASISVSLTQWYVNKKNIAKYILNKIVFFVLKTS